MTDIVSIADKSKKTFEVGDLVIFSGVSQSSIKNEIGIIIGHSASELEDPIFDGSEWYVVQFGPMKLIVNNTMIEKLESDEV